MEVWVKMFTCDNIEYVPSSFFDRAKPNRKDVLPKGVPIPEAELPESELREVATA